MIMSFCFTCFKISLCLNFFMLFYLFIYKNLLQESKENSWEWEATRIPSSLLFKDYDFAHLFGVWVCLCVCMHMPRCVNMEVRGQFVCVWGGSFLPPCGFWGLTSGSQAWKQEPLLTNPSHQPRVSWYNKVHWTSKASNCVGHGAHSSSLSSQRLGHEGGESEASLGYILRPCLKIIPNPTKLKLHFAAFVLIINSGKAYQWLLKFVDESLDILVIDSLKWSSYNTRVNRKEKQ